MDQTILVYIDRNETPALVGRFWTRLSKSKESATFQYDKNWLAHPDKFSLEPALALGPGSFHTSADLPLFGALGDSAPDRWGRALMRRAERQRAQAEKTVSRTLREVDYLLQVNDSARMGALRFAEKEGGPFLAEDRPTPIPPLMELPRLLSAAQLLAEESGTAEDLRLLLAPGTSLGGGRAKASVWDADGSLSIAKFPQRNDEIHTVLWEAVALTLAQKAGIAVPTWRVVPVAGKSILLLRRFDRAGKRRIPFLSAMSMLGAKDNESRSYLEMVDALRQHGATPHEDMHELWKRIVLNVLISNTDDHLRNHGFLYSGPKGWNLSPAYDMNPVPIDIKPRILSTGITPDDNSASLKLAFDVASYFEVDPPEAKRIAAHVAKAVGSWRSVAKALGLSTNEIDRMASAFEHADLDAAQKLP